jgi:hypothetical protein
MPIEERESTHVYHQKKMFTQEELFERESRCIHEEPAYCSAACPLRLDVRAMLKAEAAGDFTGALKVYEKITPFPHILASGCEAPCMEKCRLLDVGESVNIPALERASAAFGERAADKSFMQFKKKKTAAVFGTGIFAAFYIGEMARKNYPVTVYSEFSDADTYLAAAADFAAPEAAGRDAKALSKAGVVFIDAVPTPELFAAEKGKYDILCVSPELLATVGGELDESVLVCRDTGVISAPFGGGVLDSAFRARKAALTADRLAQELSPDNSRGEEGSTETRLYTSLDGRETLQGRGVRKRLIHEGTGRRGGVPLHPVPLRGVHKGLRLSEPLQQISQKAHPGNI